MKKSKLLLLSPLILLTPSLIAISCSVPKNTTINQDKNNVNDKPVNNSEKNEEKTEQKNDNNEENKTDKTNENNLNDQENKDENKQENKEENNNLNQNQNQQENIPAKPDENENPSLFAFPKPEFLDKNSAITHQGEITDIKSIFNHKTFPKNVILTSSNNNETLLKRYFNDEYRKVIKTFYAENLQNNLPKWAEVDYQSTQRPNSKIIPDLFARLKDENQLYKFNQRIMLSYANSNELELLNNKELIYKKDISNYLNKSFMDRKLNVNIIYAKNQNSFGFDFIQKNSIRIELDIEQLLTNKGNEPAEFIRLNSSELPLLYQAYINNENELILKVKLANNVNENFSFDSSQTNNTILYKYSSVIDISYKTIEENDEIFSLEKNTFANQIEPKLTSNGLFYSNDQNLSFTNGKRIVEYENQSLFKDIRKRVFVVGGGTSTMLGKVKPSDENDQRYYFITNRHVSDNLKNRWENSQVLKKFLIYDFDDNKVRNASDDISVDVQKDYFDFNFWEAKDQIRRDGRIENDNRKDADISISIIDIKPILAKAKAENKTKIINYLENWKNLKALKLSKKTKYLNENDYVKLYLSSFPLDSHAGFSGRRYREHIINRIENIQLSDQDQRFLTYGHFRTFIQSDDLSKKQKYDLISGGSGSVVYDENGDIVALFMQNIGDDSYGFGLLSNFEYDYFGYETSNNPNSFKNKLQKAVAEQPNKFEYFEI